MSPYKYNIRLDYQAECASSVLSQGLRGRQISVQHVFSSCFQLLQLVGDLAAGNVVANVVR
jgi:hypothetical protein